jgi:hypothetical protein
MVLATTCGLYVVHRARIRRVYNQYSSDRRVFMGRMACIIV